MAQEPHEGVVTVLFTDIVGSVPLKTSQGDVAAQNIVRDHFYLLRQQVQTHSGREIKTLGDGLMATFVSPRSAVASAIGMQRALAEGNRAKPSEQQLQLRVGLNAGEAIREDGDLFGSTVDAAARICAKAVGGQILASETVRGILGATKDVQFVDRGRFRLKGFPERWRLLEVAWQEASSAAAPALAERTPYVGREEERAELRRLMEQAIAGRGSIVLIRGEPGVGKTRLAQELVLEARQRGMVDFTGRCYEMEGAPPYIPFIEMLQQAMRRFDLLGFSPSAFRVTLGENAGEIAKILPELRRMYDDIPPPLELPPEQERMYLFNSMREFLERVSRTVPQLQILDDLHWADDATLMLLQHQAQYQDKMAVLTVATYRDIELDAARPFARTLESLVRQRLAHRVALKPLPETGVAAMLQALTGQPPPAVLVQAIYRETEGNPFFVEEVFQHLSEQGRLLDAEGRWRTDLQVGELDVPEGVRLVISRRLERVSEECRTALTDAAVVGRDFGFELLQKLSDLDADRLLDAIDEAERANLIVAADDVPSVAGNPAVEARFRFAHELIRQTLVSGLSLPRRQRLHLRVAETMEQVYGRGAQAYAADMAHHLYQAGAGADPARTARYLVLAGDQALNSAAFGEALRNYDAAFSLQPESDRGARADLLYKRGLARRSLSGQWDETLSDWREAAASYERLGDKEAAGRVFDAMGLQLLWGLRYTEGLEICLRGLALLGRRDSYYRCRQLAGVGLVLSVAGFYSAGEGVLKRSVDMAERLGDAGLLGGALTGVMLHHFSYSQFREAAESGLRGAELLRKAGGLWDLLSGAGFVTYALSFIGRLDEGSEIGREAAVLANRLGHPNLLPDFIVNLLRAGEIDAMETHGLTALERARRGDRDAPVWTGLTFLGIAHFWRGRWQEALNSFEEAAKIAPPYGTFAGHAEVFLLLTRAYMGDRDAAPALLRPGGLGSAGPAPGPAASPVAMIRGARASGLGLRGLWGIIRESRSMTKRSPLPRPGRPNSLAAWLVLCAAVEALALRGDRSEAAKLYPLVLEAMKTGNLFRAFDTRLLETLAGISAGAGEQWTQAEEHFRTALRRAEEMPHIIEQPEVRRWYARMLLDRNAPGDRETARQLLSEAIEMYRRIGMPKHVEMAETMVREV